MNRSHIHHSHRRRCRPGVEPLDGRLLLAGNVIVSVSNGALTIRGDGAANSFSVKRGSQPGTFVISGVSLGGAATTINGQARFTARGVRGDITIQGRGGGDRIVVIGDSRGGRSNPLRLPGSVTIDGGPGNDTLSLDDAVVTRAVRVVGGVGNDSLVLNRLQASKKVTVQAGDGDDLLNISAATFNDAVDIDMGRGKDRVTAGRAGSRSTEVTVRKTVTLRLGAGNDTAVVHRGRFLGAASFFGSDGRDTFVASSSEFSASVLIDGGGDRDTLDASPFKKSVRFKSTPRLVSIESNIL